MNYIADGNETMMFYSDKSGETILVEFISNYDVNNRTVLLRDTRDGTEFIGESKYLQEAE